MTVRELLALYEVSSDADRRELHQALYNRLMYAANQSASSFRPHLHQ